MMGVVDLQVPLIPMVVAEALVVPVKVILQVAEMAEMVDLQQQV
jgi:hypothetical protein